MDINMKVTEVARSMTRKGDPMWILRTTGGDRINVFDNMLERSPWDNSGISKVVRGDGKRPDSTAG